MRSCVRLILQQRHLSDNQVNNRRAKTLRNGNLIDEKWSGVQVSDFFFSIKVNARIGCPWNAVHRNSQFNGLDVQRVWAFLVEMVNIFLRPTHHDCNSFNLAFGNEIAFFRFHQWNQKTITPVNVFVNCIPFMELWIVFEYFMWTSHFRCVGICHIHAARWTHQRSLSRICVFRFRCAYFLWTIETCSTWLANDFLLITFMFSCPHSPRRFFRET